MMGWLVIFAVLGLLGWLTHSWVIIHGLAVLTPNGNWEMMGEGWHGVGYILIVGLIVGLVAGLFAGSGFAYLIRSWITSNHGAATKKLVDERIQLELEKNEMDNLIKKAYADGRRGGEEMADKAYESLQDSQAKRRGVERRADSLVGRLKGSQQKTARVKKALLTRGEAPKPD